MEKWIYLLLNTWNSLKDAHSIVCRIERVGGPHAEKQTFTFLHTNVMQRRKAVNDLTSTTWKAGNRSCVQLFVLCFDK